MHELVNKWMDARGIGPERAEIHIAIDELVRDAHLYALGDAGSRILTQQEVCDRLNVSPATLKKRLAEATPPILPARVVGPYKLFLVDDLPAIATAHIKGVVEDSETTRYISAKLRSAIAGVKHKSTVKRLMKNAGVRWPDIDGEPRTYRVDVAKIDATWFKKYALDDGWDSPNHLLRGFIVLYNELSKEKRRR